MVVYTIAIVLIVIFFAIWIWLGIKKSAEETNKINKELEKSSIETKGFLDNLHASINIVSDYGTILQTRDEGEFLSISESMLPHSKRKIVDAIILVESFIEIVLNDDSFREVFIENHDSFRFDKSQAEYLLSEKYRESLKTGLAYLEGLPPSEQAERSTTKNVADQIKEKEIGEEDITALGSDDFKTMIEGFMKSYKKSRK
ncbi:MAG: hypothetical protein MAG551_01276 [Candidatus Scalindua arabica]|uniref:Uncharacterized protein n=1 Tax=Candidatus Scalindua arabica TaxID=1127984 RepID=A0A942A038_9BACT|nr:hypothetical protein [Candidatus Scalindua arabica]